MEVSMKQTNTKHKSEQVPVPTQQMGKGDNFRIEYYKYILQQIHTLNENNHKYLTLFQTLITAIVGGGVFVFMSWKELKIEAAVARATIQGILGLIIILTIFVVLSIISNMISWLDFRKEEVLLLNQEVNEGFRKEPSWANFWRWSETYLLIFIIIAVVFIVRFVYNSVLPHIK
jgi:amino acid transporter